MFPILNPYETIALRAYRLDKVRDELAKDRQLGELVYHDQFPIMILQNRKSATPAFGHPISIGVDENRMLVVDQRQNVVVTDSMGSVRIKERREYGFKNLRASIEALVTKDDFVLEQMKTLSDVPLKIFSDLIAESFAARFGLGPETQMKIAALAGLYYLELFGPVKELSQFHRHVSMVSRVTRIDATKILEWFVEDENYIRLTSLEYFVEHIGRLDDPRLKNVNVALLFSLIGSSWYSQYGSETVCCAMEHLPTWHAICYAAVTERGYRKAKIAKLIERNFKRRGEDEDYAKTMHRFIAENVQSVFSGQYQNVPIRGHI